MITAITACRARQEARIVAGIRVGEIETRSVQDVAAIRDTPGARMNGYAPGGDRAFVQHHHIRLHHAYSPLRRLAGAIERLEGGP